jgi:TonB family protein
MRIPSHSVAVGLLVGLMLLTASQHTQAVVPSPSKPAPLADSLWSAGSSSQKNWTAPKLVTRLPLIKGSNARQAPSNIGGGVTIGGTYNVMSSDVKRVLLSPYYSNLEDAIEKYWQLPASYSGPRPIALMVISRDGRLLSTRILKSSGDREVDDMSLRAVRNAAPFGPLPGDFITDSINLPFSFTFFNEDDPKYQINGVNWGPYLKDVSRRIRHHWSPSEERQDSGAVVTFTLAKDGTLLSEKLKKSSGSKAQDQAALSAVRYAAPFKPFPTNYPQNDFTLEHSFDYFVLTDWTPSRTFYYQTYPTSIPSLRQYFFR